MVYLYFILFSIDKFALLHAVHFFLGVDCGGSSKHKAALPLHFFSDNESLLKMNAIGCGLNELENASECSTFNFANWARKFCEIGG